MDGFANSLLGLLETAAGKLEDSGSQVYAETAAKIRARVEEIKPVLADDVADAEARLLALVHDAFNGVPAAG